MAGEPKGEPRRVAARTPRPGARGRARGRSLPLGQKERGRKWRCGAKGDRGKRPPLAGANRRTTRVTRGLHLHVEQLGRLVHPDGDGALTQGFAEHFLEGIPHLIHPTRVKKQGKPVTLGTSGQSPPPRPAPRPSLPRARAPRDSANPGLPGMSSPSPHNPYVQRPGIL